MPRTSFLPRLSHITGLTAVSVTIACGGAPKIAPTFPPEPGIGACTTRIERDGHHGLIRATRDGSTIREVVDLDGDGTPEEQRIQTLDRDGRITRVERTGPNADGVLSRETRTWDGPRLVRTELDRFTADGSVGADGNPDEVHVLRWEGDHLVAEEIDQVDADGLLGVDGKPDLVTTWTWENGARTVGTRVDARDQTVLQVERLHWDGPHLREREIDLGGDGVVDTTVTQTWRGDRVVRVQVDGVLDRADIHYEYCR